MNTRLSQLRTALVILLSALLVAVVIGQTTYYTLQDGAWQDTAVWSMDGVTKCHCYPPNTLATVDVEIRDDITIDDIITVKPGCKITVEAGCSLVCTDELKLEGGDLYAYGSVDIGKLHTYPGSVAEFCDGSKIHEQCIVEGEMRMMFPVEDTLEIVETNFETMSGSMIIGQRVCLDIKEGNWVNSSDFTELTNSMVLIQEGNFDNSSPVTMHAGYIELQEGSFVNENDLILEGTCISLMEGDFDNPSGYSVNGFGTVVLWEGNIETDGYWDPEVQWCVQEGSSNAPVSGQLSDCSGALVGCDAILAVEYGGLQLEAKAQSVEVSWVVYNQENTRMFAIERSQDGETFHAIGHLFPELANVPKALYRYSDHRPVKGLSFYRIVAHDWDGDLTFSGIRSIFYNSIPGKTISIYPNPVVRDALHVEIFGSDRASSGVLSVLDIRGVPVYEKELDAAGPASVVIETAAWPAGYYLVRYRNTLNDFNKKVVVLK